MGTCIFITGGVRSGKSAFAEQYVQQLTTTAAYVATSVAFDEEMKQRIWRHQQDRHGQALAWSLYEMPYALNPHIEEEVIMFECVTTWLTNMLFLQQQKEPERLFKQWLTALLAQGKTIIIVSNEVLDGGLTAYEETNTYMQKIGQLHTWLVAQSTAAYEYNNRVMKQWK